MFALNLTLNLISSLLLQPAHAATSCQAVLRPAVKPVFSKVVSPQTKPDIEGQKYQYFSGDKMTLLGDGKDGPIRFISNGWLMEYDSQGKKVTFDGKYPEYRDKEVYASSTDPNLFFVKKFGTTFGINKLTKNGVKEIFEGDFERAKLKDGPPMNATMWYNMANYLPEYFVLKGNVFRTSHYYNKAHGPYEVGIVKDRHLETLQMDLPHTQFSRPRTLGTKAYFVNTEKNKVGVHDLVENTLVMASLKGEKLMDVVIEQTSKLSDGSPLLLGVHGFLVLSPDQTKVTRQHVFEVDGQHVTPESRRDGSLVDAYGDRVAFIPSEEYGKIADAYVVNAKTGETQKIPLEMQASNILLGDDGVVIVSYAKRVVIFDRDGKEIASKKLFEDGQKGSAGKMVRMSGREVLFLDSWAPSLLSITW